MNSIDYVSTRLESMIQQKRSKPEIVRSIAIACEGWPYVFGAWGEQCTPSGRRRRTKNNDNHACQVLTGRKSTCDGCKWDLPVRMFDCRGFTDWVLRQVGIDLVGEGATSQWNTKSNWAQRGPISEMPRNVVCCIFIQKGNTMSHTGFYLGDGGTCECSSGVQHFQTMKSGRWTHYAIPAGLYDGGEIQEPEPAGKRILRKGSQGADVVALQQALIDRGYDCGSAGADGIFGQKTFEALLRFQRDNGLTADGVCGPKTYEALEKTTGMQLYTVHVPALPLYKAQALVDGYSGAWMTKEGEAE